MKKYFLLITILLSLKGFSQTTPRKLVGIDLTTNMPRYYKDTLRTVFYKPPFYVIGDSVYLDTSRLSGALKTNQIAFGDSLNKIKSDSGLVFNPTGIVDTSKNSNGMLISPKLTATTHDIKLTTLNIQPRNSNGGYVNVAMAVARIVNSYFNIDSNNVFTFTNNIPVTGRFPISNANIIGFGAGYVSGGSNISTDVNLFGSYAGGGATNIANGNFFGNAAGFLATNAYDCNFSGYFAGRSATNANSSNFIGRNAGNGATNAYGSNFIGFSAGYQASGANYCNFIGFNVGTSATFPLTGHNNVLLGSGITLPTASSSNTMSLGNVIYATNMNSGGVGGPPISTAMANGHVGINNGAPDTSAALDIVGYKYGILLPRMTTANRLSITTGVGAGSFAASGGTGYTPGTYTAVPLTATGLSVGLGATANITVNGSGVVSAVSPVFAGYNFKLNDSLSCSSIGGGSGFQFRVTAIQKAANTLIVMDTTIKALYQYNGSYWIPMTGLSNSFSGSASSTSTFTVTIGATLESTSYKVQITPTTSIAAAPFYVNNKTLTTFDVVYLSPLTGTETFDWKLSY